MIVSSNGYFDREELSNSQLSTYKSLLEGHVGINYSKDALLLGSVVDAVLTASEMPNDIPIEVMELAEAMAASFMANKANKNIVDTWSSQVAFVSDIEYHYGCETGIVTGRCLTDFYNERFKIIADLKTTSASTDKEWDKAVVEFAYYRQAAWYMNITKSDTFVLLAVSKHKPHNLFKTVIKRGDELYNNGFKEYSAICHYLNKAYNGDEQYINILFK